jgi:hypothetical protein
MKTRKWVPAVLNRMFGLEKRHTKAQPSSGSYRPRLELMEDRIAPAVTALQTGTLLTVSLSAASDHAFVTFDGTNITVDNATAGGVNQGSFSGVTTIQIVDTGVNANQQTTFSLGTAFTQNISLTGIESADLFQRINGTVTGNALLVNVSAAGQIQDAIDIAANGATVNVAAGTYVENLVLNKQLTLLGAQDGVDARIRIASETIITPALSATRTLELTTGSAGSIIDGFTFSGGTRAIESTSGPLHNLQIRNNRIINFTEAAIFLNDAGNDITIHQNVVDGSSKASTGGLIHLDTDLFNGLHLTNNNILNGAAATGFFVDGNHNVGPSAARTPLISGNLIANNDTGINLGSRSFGSLLTLNAGTISNNVFSGNTFDGLQGGIQNVLLTQNTFISNGRWGLNLTSFGNAAADRGAQNSLITENFFLNNGSAGSPSATGDVMLSATQAAGTISTNILFNNSFTSFTAIVYNGTETINASGNWWGSSTGPTLASHPTGTGSRINGTGAAFVDFTPWLNFGSENPLFAANPGFQGDFSSLHVDDSSIQSGAVGRITEAISLLANGALVGSARIVQVEGGAYSENVNASATALTLALGTATAQVTINGNLTLSSDDRLQIDINGYTAGTAFDQLIVNGSVNLGGATLVLNETLANPVNPNFAFPIIVNDLADAVIGTLNGITQINANGHTYDVFYNFGTTPGDGNDVVLRLAAPDFLDDFNRVDSATLGVNWTNQFGAFQISGQQAFSSVTSGQASNLATVNGSLETDVVIQAEVTLTATGNPFAGLVARYSGPGLANMYWAGLIRSGATTFAQIYVNINGVWTNLSSAVVNVSSGTLRFEVVGTSLRLFLDDVLVTSAINSSITGPGLVGLWASPGNFIDDFNFTAQAPLTLVTLPFNDTFTQANGTQLTTNWIVSAGNFTIVNNAAVGSGVFNLATLNGVNNSDVSIQATVALTATVGSYAGLVARHSGVGLANLYWGGLINNGSSITANIYRIVNGTATLIAVSEVAASSGTLRFDVVGDSLSLYLNGALVAFGNDATLTTGSVGILATQGTTTDTFAAVTITPTIATLPFSDNFNTLSNGAPLSSSWLTRAGSYAGSNGGVIAVGNGSLAVLSGVNAADVDVQASVTLTPNLGAFAAVVGRYSGTSTGNMYWGGLIRTSSGVTANIYRFVNGSAVLLATQTVNTGSGTLRLRIIGDSLQLFLNGNLVAAANDSTLTSGSGGISASQGVTFDNFFMNTATRSFVTIPGPFFDSLNLPVGGTLSDVWQNRAGAYFGTGDAAAGLTAGNLATLNLTSNLTDVILEADLALAAGNAFAALTARVTGSGLSNLYWGGLVRSGGIVFAQIYRFVNGTPTLLASTPISLSAGTVRFSAVGTTLSLSINGVGLLTVTDTVLTSAGTVGISTSQGSVAADFSASTP